MTKTPSQKIKVGYVLSYRAPYYVRTQFLISVLDSIPEVLLSTAINTSCSAWRYAQTLFKLLRIRLTNNPDVYIVGFRGHEVYWPVRILTYPKPIIFDEFINMQDWLTAENNKLSPESILAKLAKVYTRSILKSSALILSDTELGAQSSSRTYNIPSSKYRTIYVGTDEATFKPYKRQTQSNKFNVFFYGNMAPLHGIDHILKAAKKLQAESVTFTIVGGKDRPKQVKKITEFIAENELSNIIYKEWLNFDELPEAINNCNLFIGGPLGDTSQSRRVITGKTYQALAMTVPTLVGEIDEDAGFKDKKNCILVRQGSAESVVRSIKWALVNKNKLSQIGKQGRELYDSNFSVQAQSHKLKELVFLAHSKKF